MLGNLMIGADGCSARAAYLTGAVIDVDGGQRYASPR